MKSMLLTGIRTMEMGEVPTPQIVENTDVLVRLKVIAVCGSDVHYYTTGKIGDQIVNYPFTVGHECAGIVEKVAAGVTTIKEGDRVAIEPAMPCFKCDQCKAGRPHTCRNLKFLGCPGQAEGSLSEFIVLPETSCLSIPDHMSYDEAAISEPLAIGLYAVNRSIPMKGAKVGILGYGPIGMCVHLSAKAKGAKDIYVTDKIDPRLAIAQSTGAVYAGNVLQKKVVKEIQELEPRGLDVVFECCGQSETIEQAIEMLKPGGLLMLIGIPEFDHWRVPVSKGRHKEVTIMNVRRQNGAVQEALELLANGKIKVDNMPTHRFAFADTKQAFDVVESYKDGVMKAMIDL